MVVTPVLEETFCLGRHKPVGRIRKLPPLVYLKAKIVNNRSWVVLLLLGGKALAFVKNQRVLVRLSLLLLGFRDRSDELCATPSRNNLLGGLPFAIKLPMTLRVAVRRVQNGAFKEVVIHNSVPRRQPKWFAIRLILKANALRNGDTTIKSCAGCGRFNERVLRLYEQTTLR